MITDDEILTILEKKEKRRFLSQLQSRSEQEGHVPSMPFLFFRNMAYPLQYAGGILLGIFLGVSTLLFIFILFVFLLHVQF